MAQKIRKLNFRSVKLRVAEHKELQRGEEDEQCQQVANFRNLQKFSQPEKFSGKNCSPKTEHLQKHKPKNYEKLR